MLEPDRSKVIVNARSSLHPIHSETLGLTGVLDIVLEDGRVEPRAPLRGEISLPVNRLRSGNPLQDRELQRRIDARRHPRIEGTLRSVTVVPGSKGYLVAGDVTFRGVTCAHSDVLEFEELDGGTLHITGGSMFDIREFGMEPPKILLLKVDPEVRIDIDVYARKEG